MSELGGKLKGSSGSDPSLATSMEQLAQLLHLDISTPVLVLAGLAVYLVFLTLTHLDHALGTSSRPDLETLDGVPLLGNLLEIQRNRSRLIEREFRFGTAHQRRPSLGNASWGQARPNLETRAVLEYES